MGEHVTIEEATAAVEAAAFLIEQEGWDMEGHPVPEDAGRRIIHTFEGPFGTDWDVSDAVDFIARSDQREWVNHWIGHDLGVRADGKVIFFDVPAPASPKA